MKQQLQLREDELRRINEKAYKCQRCASAQPPKPPPRSRMNMAAFPECVSPDARSGVTPSSDSQVSSQLGGGSARSSRRSSRRAGLTRQQRMDEEASVEATLGSFRATPAQMCAHTLVWAISHWNPPRESSRLCCCPLHAQMELAKKLLNVVAKRPCNPLWSPFAEWQCRFCACVNGHEGDECDVCGSSRAVASGDTSSFSQDMVSGESSISSIAEN